MKNIVLSAVTALGLALSGGVHAAGGSGHVEDFDFSFEGIFGTYDQFQLQRGFGVYKEVCAACHGLRQVAFRTLGDEGGPHFSEAEVKAIAKEYDIFDKDLDDTRPGKPSDKFPAGTDAHIPDLSLMAKGRAGFHGPYGLGINQFFKGIGGPEYIASILTGYTGKEKEQAGQIFYENTAFPGGWIAMAPPLSDGQVEFLDGHSNDLHHMSEDVAAFLMWTAEPKMASRKRIGMLSVSMLTLLAVLLYFTNKKIWAPIKRKDH